MACRCCGKCRYCIGDNSFTLQASVSISNNLCNSTPGCAVASGDFVLQRRRKVLGAGGFESVPSADGPACYWSATGTDLIVCSTGTCDSCGCNMVYTKEGNECDPLVPSDCDRVGVDPITRNENSDCGLCDSTFGCSHTCDSEPVTPPEYCYCVSDVSSSTGYRCSCNGNCFCTPLCVISFSFEVWMFKTVDGDIVVAVKVTIGNQYCYGYETWVTPTDGVLDCEAEIDSLTISLTPQSGASLSELCFFPLSITLDFI